LKLSKDNFHILLGLTKKQPWLEDRYIGLNKLIFDDCSSQDQKELILDLLNRFEYVSRDKFIKALSEMAEDIVNDPDLNDETTQIVAMAADSTADSSQYVLYGLKPILRKYGWIKYKHVNRFGQAYNTYKNSKQHKNIVLVDEFVGSGKTVLNRIKEINSVFIKAKVSDYSVKIKTLVSTEIGAKAITACGLVFTSQIILQKGISDYYTNFEVKDKIELMLSLEFLLKKKYLGRSLPSLGFGSTESLYCRQDGNTPNNVFPIFWWPVYRNGDIRPTVLTRAMGDA
jgi:hypothetical protein